MGKEQIRLNQVGHQAYTISFSLSDVCLEGQYHDQLSEIMEKSKQFFLDFAYFVTFQKLDERDTSQDYLQECDS